MNSETGLEQWFELEQRPPGASSDQPLTLEMTLASNLAASQQGNTVAFVSAGSVNAPGASISYTKLKAWDASGRELPARMQLHARQLSLIIDDADARYPLAIDPALAQQAYLKASNTGAGDVFGISVAVAGDTLVVGAVFEDSNATGVNGDQSDNSADAAGAAYVFDIVITNAPTVASFHVIKDFSDDNPLPVEVHIDCNTGLPLNQNFTIADDGDPDGGVTFVVDTFISGELDCTITETTVAGYAVEYENVSVQEVSDAACFYTAVEVGAEHSCVISNQVLPVPVDVTKQWFTPGTGGDSIGTVARIAVFSPTTIEGGDQCFNNEVNENGYCKSLDFTGPATDTQSVLVLPHWAGVTVLIDEQVFDDAIETVNECDGSVQILPDKGASCTITNTVFFEGIPALNQYGLALLSLLMLGVGLIGFRRFV